MVHPDLKYLRAVATMVGSVVGVGVFGLPYVFSRSGSVLGMIVLLLLGAAMVGILFMFADVTAHTPGNHRFPGTVSIYLGPAWGRVASASITLGFWGAMLAYLVAGGRLLGSLAGTEGAAAEALFALGLAAAVGALSYRGLKFVAGIEVWLLALLSFLFLFVALAALPHARLGHLTDTTVDGGLLALYGVVFFSLTGGLSAVPEMRSLLGRKRSLSHAVFVGMLAVVALYTAFTLPVVAATGSGTSEFALDALIPLVGSSFKVVGTVLALVAIVSIFTVGSVELQNTLRYDAGLKRRSAWALAGAIPIVLYLVGIRSFIDILGFIGAVFAGVNGILVVMTYERMRSSKVCREHVCLEVPRAMTFGLIALYLAGVLVTLYSTIVTI